MMKFGNKHIQINDWLDRILIFGGLSDKDYMPEVLALSLRDKTLLYAELKTIDSPKSREIKKFLNNQFPECCI